MRTLTFTCPSTGREFSSAIHTDLLTLAQIEQMPVRMSCPVCSQRHLFGSLNGRLEPDMAKPVPIAAAEAILPAA